MSKKRTYTLTEKVFIWPGEQGNWHFVYVPKKESVEIKNNFGVYAKGFRSIPVELTIGHTTWNTSIFPDSHSGCYLVPLKAIVRKREDVYAEDVVTYKLKIRI